MKTLFLTALLVLSGCSATLQERLSTDTYWANEKTNLPHVSEHPVGIRNHLGYLKRLIVHNPLSVGIRAFVICSSMFQADEWIHVKANAIRYLLVSGAKELDQTCFLTKYYRDDEATPLEDQ